MIAMAQMLAFPAILIPQLRKQNGTIHLNGEAESWYTSVNSLVSPFGSVVGGFMMDRYGRRITLAVPLVPIILSWFATAIAQTSSVLFTSRIILGICSGFLPPVCQVN